MIGIINLGVSNIRNICRFFDQIKKNYIVIQNIRDFNRINILILPGVGSFGSGAEEIKKKIDLAKTLGAKIIIFGSPRNRKTFKKGKYMLDKIGLNMFKKIASYTNKRKIIFCLEANPKIYKAGYLNYTRDVISIVKKINNRYLKVNLDLSTIISNKENIKKIIKENISIIAHAQISAPYLLDILKYKKKIKELIKLLRLNNYKKNISIEMTKPKKNSYKQIEKSIDYVQNLITIK